MVSLFGFNITRKKDEDMLPSFVPKTTDDGAVVVETGGVYGTFVDMDGSIRTEAELVNKYRDMSNQPDVDQAIENIINEVIVQEPESKLVELLMDDLKQPDKVKNVIINEFEEVLKLLEFNDLAYEIFRRWYVDGRLYYHAIIDEKNPLDGVKELRYIDPRKIRKVRENRRKKATNNVKAYTGESEYFIYNDKGFAKLAGAQGLPSNMGTGGGIKIAKDSIIHCTSGLTSDNGDLVKSYLHKSIKILNQLRTMEDALVIYRVSRAPERRIFYIDVGELPKIKAEQYLRDQMTRFKNKIVYNSETGEIRSDRKHMTMLEDFWLARRGSGTGTEITTLPGGCFSMNTKVSLLDGRELSITEIEEEIKCGKQLWAYSCDEYTGEIKPGLISWAGVTQESAQVMKITLDNGESFICTPDHKFPQYGQEYKRAHELKIGDQFISKIKENIIKINDIEYLSEPMQVGTLTIDQDELIHNHHTFALSCGVMTFNSNLSQIDDIVYFRKNLYRALNVPLTRLDPEAQSFNFGRGSEISRDEVNFAKFTNRLRGKFSQLFLRVLERQLILKNLVNPEEWEELKPYIKFKFTKDNYFDELKESEVLKDRLNTLKELDPYIGKYVSNDWARRNVLKQTDTDIEETNEQIAEEVEDPQYMNPEMEGGEDMYGGPDQGGQPPQ